MQRAIQIFYLLHFTASFKSLNFQLRAAGISWKTQHWHIIAFKVNMVNFLACLDSEQHYRSYPDTRRVQPQFIFILLVRIWSCGSLGLLLADMWPWCGLLVAPIWQAGVNHSSAIIAHSMWGFAHNHNQISSVGFKNCTVNNILGP